MPVERDILAVPYSFAVAVCFGNVVPLCTRQSAKFTLFNQLMDVEPSISTVQFQNKLGEVVLPTEFALPDVECSGSVIDLDDFVEAVGVPDCGPSRHTKWFLNSRTHDPAMHHEAIGKVEPIAIMASSNPELPPLALEVPARLSMVNFHVASVNIDVAVNAKRWITLK